MRWPARDRGVAGIRGYLGFLGVYLSGVIRDSIVGLAASHIRLKIHEMLLPGSRTRCFIFSFRNYFDDVMLDICLTTSTTAQRMNPSIISGLAS